MKSITDWIKPAFKTERRQSLVFTLLMFFLGWWLAKSHLDSWLPIDEPLFQNLAALIIGTFWVERLFTPPRDSLANAFAGIILTLSLLRDAAYIPSVLALLAVYYTVVLFSAGFASWRLQGEGKGPFGWAFDLANIFAVWGGRATLVYSLAFLVALTPLARTGDEVSLARFLLLWVLIVSLPDLIRRIGRVLSQEAKPHVGLVTSATSPMNIEALIPINETLSVADLVEFEDTCKLCDRLHPIKCYGRVVNIRSDIHGQ